VAQIALNWLLQRPTVATVIIGARNADQLRQNLGAVDWRARKFEQILELLNFLVHFEFRVGYPLKVIRVLPKNRQCMCPQRLVTGGDVHRMDDVTVVSAR
jgi:Aldo/keto reductase family